MLVRWIAILTMALLLIPLTSKAIEIKGYSFKSGSWNGNAYKSDTTGRFTHCSITGRYKSGIILAFALRENFELLIGLQNKTWNIPVTDSFKLGVIIDGVSYGQSQGRAISKDLIRVNFGRYPKILEALKRGRKLQIISSKRKFSFLLPGTNIALGKLLNCVNTAKVNFGNSRKILSQDSLKNPFSSDPKPTISRNRTNESGPTGKNQLSDNGSLRNFLSDDQKKYVSWLPSFTTAYKILSNGLSDVTILRDASIDYLNKRVSSDYARSLADNSKLKVNATISRYKNYLTLINQTTFQTRKYINLKNSSLTFLDSFREQLIQSQIDGSELIAQVLAGKASAAIVSAKNIENIIKLLDSENGFLSIQKTTVKLNHPQHSLYDTIISSNNTLVEILKYRIKEEISSVSSQINSFPNKSVLIDRVNNLILNTRRLISEGKLQTDKFIKRYNNSKLSRSSKMNIVKLFETYYEGFEIEEAIVRVFQSVIKNLDSDSFHDQASIALENLVNRRTEIQQIRVAFINQTVK